MRKFCVGLLLSIAANDGFGDDVDKAIRMHNRLTGTPPKPDVLEQMATLVGRGSLKEAALIATETEEFLRITLKNMVAPWTNEDASNSVPLNDYTATVIGVIRDNLSFKTLFSDVVYTGADTLGLPVYANDNNDHYEAFEVGNFRFSDTSQFVRQSQTMLTGFAVGAGVLTSRGFAAAYYDAGTNRLPFAAVMATYTCNEIEQLHDNTLNKSWIRQDVERSPGGDVKLYLAKCSGCHGLMDGLTPAFAHNDFVDGVNIYDPNVIPEKMTRNAYIFPEGRRIASDEWVNFMVDGANKAIGWQLAPVTGRYTGRGIVAFGEMVMNTDAFATCMAKKAFKQVCLKVVDKPEEEVIVSDLAASFVAEDFKMKNLFAETATKCAE